MKQTKKIETKKHCSTVMGPTFAVVPGVGAPSSLGGQSWPVWDLQGGTHTTGFWEHCLVLTPPPHWSSEDFGAKAVDLGLPLQNPPLLGSLIKDLWSGTRRCRNHILAGPRASVSPAGKQWSVVMCSVPKASLKSLSVFSYENFSPKQP